MTDGARRTDPVVRRGRAGACARCVRCRAGARDVGRELPPRPSSRRRRPLACRRRRRARAARRAPGDAARGRALLVARESANCVLCHAVPDPAVRFAGNVGPSLAGVGARLTAAQLRLRVADNLRVNPASVMPSYYSSTASTASPLPTRASRF